MARKLDYPPSISSKKRDGRGDVQNKITVLAARIPAEKMLQMGNWISPVVLYFNRFKLYSGTGRGKRRGRENTDPYKKATKEEERGLR